jgi:hypothetical protein
MATNGWNGKPAADEHVFVVTPAEGFRNRAAARFSCYWSGSADHFLDAQGVTGPGECGRMVRRAWDRGSRCGRPGRDSIRMVGRPGTQWVPLDLVGGPLLGDADALVHWGPPLDRDGARN